MKVYLGCDSECGHCEHNFDSNMIGLFASQILDSEATEIICENLFSNFYISELPDLISLVCKKVRLKGKLIIKDFDFYFTSKIIFRNELPIEDLNVMIFENRNKIKSIFTLETLESFLPQDSFRVTKKEFGKTNFTIHLERVK
jgi:hypothetical protein